MCIFKMADYIVLECMSAKIAYAARSLGWVVGCKKLLKRALKS